MINDLRKIINKDVPVFLIYAKMQEFKAISAYKTEDDNKQVLKIDD